MSNLRVFSALSPQKSVKSKPQLYERRDSNPYTLCCLHSRKNKPQNVGRIRTCAPSNCSPAEATFYVQNLNLVNPPRCLLSLNKT